MKRRLGVCIVGSGGAVATTVISGVELMKRGMAERIGMVTESALAENLDLASIDDLVFAGWDLNDEDAFEAATRHRVIHPHTLEKIEDVLHTYKPWPGVVSEKFLASNDGRNVVAAKSFREEIDIITSNIEDFRQEHDLHEVVMVNLSSTERYIEESEVHQSLAAFEAGLDADDPRISPAMKYLYVACKLGIPHCNFTPSLSNIPALVQLAEASDVPLAGADGKTGQTLLKTVLAPAFAMRGLLVDGWYSTNILGNNDGKVLDDPGSNKTKVTSKRAVLDDLLGYKVADHQVHIHYYKPRGDAKEAWDNIDLSGFLGEPMQVKVNFLCKDSILAAPLVIDLVRLLDRAKRAGENGIQRQFSVFFKSPYHAPGERPVHGLSDQYQMLKTWTESLTATESLKPASLSSKNGNGDRPAARSA